MNCNRPGCGGAVDDTGFCDVCFRKPLAAAPVRQVPAGGDTCGAGCPRSGGRGPLGTWDIAGLVALPILAPPDPTSRLIDAQGTTGSRRICGRDGCAGEIGGSYAGQPARMEGTCPACGKRYSLRPRLHPGDLVAGQYEVLGPLAQSGFGWVYLARDLRLDGNYVVLKGLINANDSRAAEMAVRERQYLTRLSHPNIVRIFNAATHADPESGEHDGYIVMEYVDGPSLEEVRLTALRCDRDCARLPLEHILAMGHEILAAMGYLHGQGLLYCDMKPANVIRGRDRITVIDLGGMSEIAAADRAPVGTPTYQVPGDEIRQRGVTVKSDVFTVGRTLDRLYLNSGGMRPDALRGDVPPEVAESFERLVRRATHRDYDQRFASAAEMAEQLTGVLRELMAHRDGTEHPSASTLFAPTAVLIDDGLGSVPPLTRWTTAARTAVDRPPAHRDIALGLPIPRTDPADPAARFLADGTTYDPRDLIDRLTPGGEHSAELWLRGCRAQIELDDPEAAARCLDEAERTLTATPGQWRVRWYHGLLALTRADLPGAVEAFTAVADFWPGEPAPKLALALCQERAGAWPDPLYSTVWQRDRSQTGAAFGLARLRLRTDDRPGAVRVLDEVPLMSPHRDAARIAAVRALVEPLARPPTISDLEEADRRLPLVRLDGGAADGDARQRLTALVRQAWHDRGRDDVRGPLERSYRELARQARGERDHERLVDLANGVRPRTLLTWWR